MRGTMWRARGYGQRRRAMMWVGMVAAAALCLAGLLGGLGALGGLGQPATARASGFTDTILYIHGFDTKTTPKTNCSENINGGTMRDYFVKNGFTGAFVTVGYYTVDDCDINLSAGTDATPGPGRCTDEVGAPGTDPNKIGTTSESISLLGCVFAWKIWDEYTNLGKPVRIVAHSMGGIIARWALHCVSMTDANYPGIESRCHGYPPSLNVSEIVQIASPNGGIPGIADRWCSQCLQLQELGGTGADGDFIAELHADTNSGRVPGGYGFGSLDWVLMSSVCDRFTDTTDVGVDDSSVFDMPGTGNVHKFDYFDVPESPGGVAQCQDQGGDDHNSYSHGQYLTDNLDTKDATYAFCTGCSNSPLNSLSGSYHSLHVVCNALSICSFPAPTPTNPPTPTHVPTSTPTHAPTSTPSPGVCGGTHSPCSWTGWESSAWGAYRFVRGGFTIPQLPATNYSGMTMWVGFNGDPNEVGSAAGWWARAGVEYSVDDVGDTSYYPFWDVTDTTGAQRAYSTYNGFVVNPGDHMSFNVWYDGAALHFDMYDSTRGAGVSNQTYGVSGWKEYSAEWIVSHDSRLLTRWTSSGFAFSNCQGSPDNASWYPITHTSHYGVTMYRNTSGGVLADPGSLNGSGDGFAPVWHISQ